MPWHMMMLCGYVVIFALKSLYAHIIFKWVSRNQILTYRNPLESSDWGFRNAYRKKNDLQIKQQVLLVELFWKLFTTHRPLLWTILQTFFQFNFGFEGHPTLWWLWVAHIHRQKTNDNNQNKYDKITIGGSAATLAPSFDRKLIASKTSKTTRWEPSGPPWGGGWCGSREEMMQQGTHTSWVPMDDIV